MGFDLNAMLSQSNAVKQIPLDMLVPYREHKFKLYAGERLADMVESIKANGVLTPIIARVLDNGNYEILAGHNRVNAAKIAGFTAVPSVIKEHLSDDEAKIYVIETNLIQRGFSDLSISEQAAAAAMEYESAKSYLTEKRNEIQRELDILAGNKPKEKSLSPPETNDSMKETGEKYGLSKTQIARLIRISKLPFSFQPWIDSGELSIRAGVELSYIKISYLKIICSICSDGCSDRIDNYSGSMSHKIDYETAKTIRDLTDRRGFTDGDYIKKLITRPAKALPPTKSVKINTQLFEKCFNGKAEKDINEIIEEALKLYMKRKGIHI
ncbi:MAG: ParB N-terminal domain-containing protein [Ruminococcus sp.]|jgi:ParB family chromosome partitioning protein|nr:ParB N-terminal domain-containing protein [Ruminococcus sp.]